MAAQHPAAAYAAALATLNALANGKHKAITDAGLRVEDMTAAALAFVCARLAADEAQERRLVAKRAGGWRAYGIQGMYDLDAECERLDEIALDAYRALVALLAGAAGEVAP